MKTLYPELEPYQRFFLETESVHSVYVELSGNPEGIPVIFLHGGPCSGTQPHHRRFFDPQKFMIILFDQRGCGQSLPFGESTENTTQHLIDDMERIRVKLGFSQWLLFGGSWGGALALLYAQQYRQHVSAMIIRGVFLARRQDLDWFIKSGVNHIYPEQWQQLLSAVDPEDLPNLIQGLHNALHSGDELTRIKAAKAWDDWGAQVALGRDYQGSNSGQGQSNKQVLQARMELHFAQAHYFIRDNQILDNCQQLAAIPTIIIHGRYDLVCPIAAGLQLHQALKKSEFTVLATAGHVAKGTAMIDALVSAADTLANQLLGGFFRVEG